jgi:hypothetical protein
MSSTETHEHEVRCLRPGCGRKLTSEASTRLGYGPVCLRKIRAAAIAEAKADYTEDQRDKADMLIRDGGAVPTGHRGVFRMAASDGSTSYLTHAKGCNCDAGRACKRAVPEKRARRDGRLVTVRPCYHTLVARILGIASRPAKPFCPLAAVPAQRLAPVACPLPIAA